MEDRGRDRNGAATSQGKPGGAGNSLAGSPEGTRKQPTGPLGFRPLVPGLRECDLLCPNPAPVLLCDGGTASATGFQFPEGKSPF